ncbi:unnamed protein product [Ambrosiozyma monospora]|uniref:Unnamed protein product n=1 Tax=Ambrosiozyma monospora TaxID=43982 RepID=A0ACB5UAG0_AMBMO|nr:unnamed protein product [Ambrosiozyma monospora]
MSDSASVHSSTSKKNNTFEVQQTHESSDSVIASPPEKQAKKTSKWITIFFPEEDHHEIQKKHADVTLDLLQQSGSEELPDLTPAQEKKLYLKLWLTILPCCFFVNAILFTDKDAIAYSQLLGVWEDMHFGKQQYNNIQTYYYVGYILGQIPSHYLFQRLPLSKFISGVVFIWSLLSFCTIGSSSYGAR